MRSVETENYSAYEKHSFDVFGNVIFEPPINDTPQWIERPNTRYPSKGPKVVENAFEHVPQRPLISHTALSIVLPEERISKAPILFASLDGHAKVNLALPQDPLLNDRLDALLGVANPENMWDDRKRLKNQIWRYHAIFSNFPLMKNSRFFGEHPRVEQWRAAFESIGNYYPGVATSLLVAIPKFKLTDTVVRDRIHTVWQNYNHFSATPLPNFYLQCIRKHEKVFMSDDTTAQEKAVDKMYRCLMNVFFQRGDLVMDRLNLFIAYAMLPELGKINIAARKKLYVMRYVFKRGLTGIPPNLKEVKSLINQDLAHIASLVNSIDVNTRLAGHVDDARLFQQQHRESRISGNPLIGVGLGGAHHAVRHEDQDLHPDAKTIDTSLSMMEDGVVARKIPIGRSTSHTLSDKVLDVDEIKESSATMQVSQLQQIDNYRKNTLEESERVLIARQNLLSEQLRRTLNQDRRNLIENEITLNKAVISQLRLNRTMPMRNFIGVQIDPHLANSLLRVSDGDLTEAEIDDLLHEMKPIRQYDINKYNQALQDLAPLPKVSTHHREKSWSEEMESKVMYDPEDEPFLVDLENHVYIQHEKDVNTGFTYQDSKHYQYLSKDASDNVDSVDWVEVHESSKQPHYESNGRGARVFKYTINAVTYVMQAGAAIAKDMRNRITASFDVFTEAGEKAALAAKLKIYSIYYGPRFTAAKIQMSAGAGVAGEYFTSFSTKINRRTSMLVNGLMQRLNSTNVSVDEKGSIKTEGDSVSLLWRAGGAVLSCATWGSKNAFEFVFFTLKIATPILTVSMAFCFYEVIFNRPEIMMLIFEKLAPDSTSVYYGLFEELTTVKFAAGVAQRGGGMASAAFLKWVRDHPGAPVLEMFEQAQFVTALSNIGDAAAELVKGYLDRSAATVVKEVTTSALSGVRSMASSLAINMWPFSNTFNFVGTKDPQLQGLLREFRRVCEVQGLINPESGNIDEALEIYATLMMPLFPDYVITRLMEADQWDVLEQLPAHPDNAPYYGGTSYATDGANGHDEYKEHDIAPFRYGDSVYNDELYEQRTTHQTRDSVGYLAGVQDVDDDFKIINHINNTSTPTLRQNVRLRDPTLNEPNTLVKRPRVNDIDWSKRYDTMIAEYAEISLLTKVDLESLEISLDLFMSKLIDLIGQSDAENVRLALHNFKESLSNNFSQRMLNYARKFQIPAIFMNVLTSLAVFAPDLRESIRAELENSETYKEFRVRIATIYHEWSRRNFHQAHAPMVKELFYMYEILLHQESRTLALNIFFFNNACLQENQQKASEMFDKSKIDAVKYLIWGWPDTHAKGFARVVLMSYETFLNTDEAVDYFKSVTRQKHSRDLFETMYNEMTGYVPPRELQGYKLKN